MQHKTHNMKTSNKHIETLFQELQSRPIFKDQRLVADGDSLHIIGDYFQDRIAGNGRMPGYVGRIEINERGIIISHSGDLIVLKLSLMRTLPNGETSITAYEERRRNYWKELKSIPSPILSSGYTYKELNEKHQAIAMQAPV